MAREDRFHGDYDRWARKPEVLLDVLYDKARQRRIEIIRKRPGALLKNAQAIGRKIFLGEWFDAKDTIMRCVTIAHELVHNFQQAAYGLYRWLARYGSDHRFRWAQEVQALRQNMVILRLCGASRKFRREYARKKAREMKRKYALWRLRTSDVVKWTEQLMLEKL